MSLGISGSGSGQSNILEQQLATTEFSGRERGKMTIKDLEGVNELDVLDPFLITHFTLTHLAVFLSRTLQCLQVFCL